jgi:hypothetical protein
MSYQLDTDALDRSWNNWLNEAKYSSDQNDVVMKLYISRPRKYNVGRNTLLGKQFEDWLWDHGAYVFQKQGKRCAHFSDYDAFISFKLTWCLK